GEQQQVVVALELARAGGAVPVRLHAVMTLREAPAAVVGLVQPQLLDHGAHGTIEDQDPLGQRGLEPGDAVGVEPGQAVHGFLAIREITSKCGGRFSRVTVSALISSSPARVAKRRSSLSVKPRLTWP